MEMTQALLEQAAPKRGEADQQAMRDRITMVLRSLAEQNGGLPPTQAEFHERAAFSATTLKKAFGNYGNACEAAGLPRPTRGGARQPKKPAKPKATTKPKATAPKPDRVARAIALLREEANELDRRLKKVENAISAAEGR